MVSFKRFNASRYSQIQSSRILRLVQIDLKKWFKRRVVEIPAKSREVPAPRLKSVTRRATPECPHPCRWSALDAVNPEIEVLDFMRTIVMTIKPELVVQTGARNGVSSIWLAEGLKVNGIGVLVACESDKAFWQEARTRTQNSAVAEWIHMSNHAGVELKVKGQIDLLFLNSDASLREAELRCFLPQLNPNGLILMSDANSDLNTVRQIASRLEAQGLISVVLLSTPSGLVVAQKRAGRI